MEFTCVSVADLERKLKYSFNPETNFYFGDAKINLKQLEYDLIGKIERLENETLLFKFKKFVYGFFGLSFEKINKIV